jgi:hypothetical protein
MHLGNIVPEGQLTKQRKKEVVEVRVGLDRTSRDEVQLSLPGAA